MKLNGKSRTTETNGFPGPKSREMIEEFTHYVAMTPQPFVLDLARCEGMWLATVDGQRIFDWAGYYGAKLLGHNHRRLREPDYLEQLAMAANNKIANPDFLTDICLDYYRLLYEIAPRCMAGMNPEVYVVNSGAEAVENMMKYFISLYDARVMEQGQVPSVRRFLYFDRAFHGRTVFALNVTQLDHDPVVTQDFKGFVPGNIQVPFPALDTSQSQQWNADRLGRVLTIIEDSLKRYRNELVGIILEPIQGAGGQRLALPRFYRRLSELAYNYDVFLGVDEVQTAGGQTGTMFAIDQFDLPYPPQAVATAKKFANGVIYMLESVGNLGILDSTWGGSLVDMVRFMQEMKIVRDECLIEQVPEKTERLVGGLNALADKYSDLIFNVRGLGLYQGFTLRDPTNRNRLKSLALQKEHLLLLGAGTQSIRFRPVLDVTIDNIELMLAKLDRALAAL
jgi:L-lysine 6-transaminase